MSVMHGVIEVIRVARKEKGTISGYKRACRALKAIGLSAEDQITVLVRLDYCHPDTRKPYKWLADKLQGT